MGQDRKNPRVDKSSALWELSSLGMEFVFIIIACLYAGVYLDRKLEWNPWGTLAGIAIGFAYGLYYIIIRSAKLKEEKEKKNDI